MRRLLRWVPQSAFCFAHVTETTCPTFSKRYRLIVLLALASVVALVLFGRSLNATKRGGQEPAEPFRIAGNLYYVGANDVSAFLITGLIIPSAFHWRPALTVIAATVLAIESVVFIGVHAKYREVTPIIMSAVLGLLMAFIAYGRWSRNDLLRIMGSR